MNARYNWLVLVFTLATRSWTGEFELRELDVSKEELKKITEEREKATKEKAAELQERVADIPFTETPSKQTALQKVKSFLGVGTEANRTPSSPTSTQLTEDTTKKTFKEKTSETLSSIGQTLKDIFTPSPKKIIIEGSTSEITKELADKNTKGLEDIDKSNAKIFFSAVTNFALTFEERRSLEDKQQDIADSIDVLISEKALAQLTRSQRMALSGWLDQISSNYLNAQRDNPPFNTTIIDNKIKEAKSGIQRFDSAMNITRQVINGMDGQGVSVDSQNTLTRILSRRAEIDSFKEEIQKLPSMQDVITALDEVAKSKVLLSANQAESLKIALRVIQLKYQNIEQYGNSDQKKKYDENIQSLTNKIKQLDEAISKKIEKIKKK
ncbi:MAG: hypothetical protein WCE21_02085 [Candidatus Babeliales bacterium]